MLETRELQFRNPLNERVYTVSQTAQMFAVDKRVVMKWLELDDGGKGVIPPRGWFRLPKSGHIRIRESAIMKLQKTG